MKFLPLPLDVKMSTCLCVFVCVSLLTLDPFDLFQYISIQIHAIVGEPTLLTINFIAMETERNEMGTRLVPLHTMLCGDTLSKSITFCSLLMIIPYTV
jgi:hypothetical protein